MVTATITVRDTFTSFNGRSDSQRLSMSNRSLLAQSQQDVVDKYRALRRDPGCDYTQAVACVIRQRKPGDPITDTFMDAVLFPFTHDPIKLLTPADTDACVAYLLWWAHHGVHPVRIAQELRNRGQQTVADDTWNFIRHFAHAFGIAVPLMDAETNQAADVAGALEFKSHLGQNLRRRYHHIAPEPGSHGIVMYKKGGLSLDVYTPFAGDELSRHKLDDGAIISFNGNKILATNGSQDTVLQWFAGSGRVVLDVPPGVSIVKCYDMGSDASDTLSLTRDGNLCLNNQVLHTVCDPCVDVVPVMTKQQYVPCFMVLSSDGSVAFVQFWRSTPDGSFTVQAPNKAWRMLNDPVVQIASRGRDFDQVVALHVTGKVTVHDIFMSTHTVSVVDTGNERVTLLPKTIATYNMALDDGRYVMSFLAVVNYSKLCCIRRIFSEEPRGGITREFLVHEDYKWDVIKLRNDRRQRNNIFVSVIEMVQHVASCYLLTAQGSVYECHVDYDGREYTVEPVGISVSGSFASAALGQRNLRF